MFSQLQALCPDKGPECNTKTKAYMDKISTIKGIVPTSLNLTMVISDSKYDNPDARDRMLSLAIATWQQASAAAKSCQDVTYYGGEVDNQCMTTGPVKRSLSLPLPSDLELGKRSPVRHSECPLTAKLCAAPDHISKYKRDPQNSPWLTMHCLGVVSGPKDDPYAYTMNIDVASKLDTSGESAFDKFICELIILGLTTAAATLAPELVVPELLTDVEFSAICQ
jgi:hypothetical protein